MNCSKTGFLVLHCLLEIVQTHVHWVSDAIQQSHPVFPFSSCPQSLWASGSFPMSQLFISGDQGIRTSASASVLPMNIRDWLPLGLTGFISLLSKGLSEVFSSTTIWKHHFFGTQPSLWSNYYFVLCTVIQSCLTLWDPMDCSPPGSSVHGMSQTRILEWVAISFSRECSQPRDRSGSHALQADSLPSEPPGKPQNTGVGSLSLLQGIFLTELSLYILSKGSFQERKCKTQWY